MTKDKVRAFRRKEYCFWCDNEPCFNEYVVHRVWISKDRYFDGRLITQRPSRSIQLQAVNPFDISRSSVDNEKVSIQLEDIKRIDIFNPDPSKDNFRYWDEL